MKKDSHARQCATCLSKGTCEKRGNSEHNENKDEQAEKAHAPHHAAHHAMHHWPLSLDHCAAQKMRPAAYRQRGHSVSLAVIRRGLRCTGR